MVIHTTLNVSSCTLVESKVFPEPQNYITDATPAFFCLVILFLLPSEHSDSTILEWPKVRSYPTPLRVKVSGER